jgi:hypothetical protein
MYPLSETSLSLADVAKHWARDLPQRPPADEVFERLLQEVWANHLKVHRDLGTEFGLADLLRVVSVVREQPGITFYEDPIELPPEFEFTPNCAVLVDPNVRVYLPRDRAAWTSKIIEEACNGLKECRIAAYEVSAVLAALRALDVQKDEFRTFCESRGHIAPEFWFGVSTDKKRSFAGRPSVMRRIVAEMERRAAVGALESTLRAEAGVLADWAKTNIPDAQIPKRGSLENAVRPRYWELKQKT